MMMTINSAALGEWTLEDSGYWNFMFFLNEHRYSDAEADLDNEIRHGLLALLGNLSVVRYESGYDVEWYDIYIKAR